MLKPSGSPAPPQLSFAKGERKLGRGGLKVAASTTSLKAFGPQAEGQWSQRKPLFASSQFLLSPEGDFY